MSTTTTPPSVLSDLEAVCAALAKGQAVDREVAGRVHQRAEKVKEDIRRQGVTDVAVSLIREIRDEE
ncbi:MAG TPA: hypothetical protein VG125_13225 [Pirellulales bacterium]|jgi:hypothetical protein|nr:hypothetical protein [Pirellulales bacterium]